MIVNKFFEYISHDGKCLLGLISNKNDITLLSPLNEKFLYPALDSNHESALSDGLSSSKETNLTNKLNWLINTKILLPSNVDLTNGNFENSKNDWNILTSLNLSSINSNNKIFDLNNYSFSSKIFIDTTNIENKKIQIFKQGDDNLNGVFDVCFEFNRSNFPDGSADKFIINVYYELANDSSSINKQSVEIKSSNFNFIDPSSSVVFDFSKFLNQWIQLTITIDSINGLIKVYIDDYLVNTTPMNLLEMIELPLNTPVNSLEKNSKFIIGGSTNLKMKNAFVFNRCINPMELKFLNKLNNN